MGLVWIIFTDPELVLGQGRPRKLDAVLCPGKFWSAVFGCLALGWVSQRRSPRAKKTSKPFTAAADRLEYHPLTSTDRKLKLKLLRTGSLSSVTSEMGEGGRTSGFHFPPCTSRNRCGRQTRERQKPLAVLHPLTETPTGRQPCLGPPSSPRAPNSQHQLSPLAELESPCSPVNPIHAPPIQTKVTRIQGSPQPGRAKLPNSSLAPAPLPAPPTQS